MGEEIVCLLVYNISLSSRISKFLVRLASEMLHRRQKRRSFDSPALQCEGSIKTKFERAQCGHFSGTVFEANLDTNRGKATVKFLVDDSNPADLMSVDDEELFIQKRPKGRSNNDSYRHN